MIRAVAVGVCAVAATLALASSGSPRTVEGGGTLRMAVPAEEFDSIDAAITGSPGTTPVVQATCASLMYLPDKPLPGGRRVVPELATGYPRITNGGRTYTFTLRKDARFSTGSPVTAADVAHTINRALNPRLKSYVASFLTGIVGAKRVLTGKAKAASGVVAHGKTLMIKLTRPLGDFEARVARAVCVVPRYIGTDPEGVKAPVPTAAPYVIAEYVAGERVLLERNRFYRGPRPHRVDRVEIDLTLDSAAALDRVASGRLDYAWVPTGDYADRAAEFQRRYGLNKKRFFAIPASFLRYFALNTRRPLFRDNTRLRQAVNVAIDRKALLRARGPLAGYLTDQYLPPGSPGFRNATLYPLHRPNVARARRLAKHALRSGKAVLYAPSNVLGSTQAQIVKANLAKIGLDVTIKKLPVSLYFQKVATPGEPFDIAWAGWLADLPDPSLLNDLFAGENSPDPNFSHFDSRLYNARLDRASRLVGPARYRTYGSLDVDLARDAAPAIAYAYDNALTLVSKRVGCIVLNPYLDLAAVCLK